MEKVARYILDNPVRKGIVADYHGYPFSWCDIFGFVGQGFRLAEQANPNVCPNVKSDNVVNLCRARFQPCETSNPEGLPYKRLNTHSQGFTLIEIVIAIVLVGILASVAAMIIMQGIRAYSSEDVRSDGYYQARFAMDRMSREIRLIRSTAAVPVDDIATMNTTTLVYYAIDNTQLGFRLSGGNIERTQDGGTNWYQLTRLTAPDAVTAPGGVFFTYLTNTGAPGAAQATLWYVQIQFTVTRGTESFFMSTRVHPMNF